MSFALLPTLLRALVAILVLAVPFGIDDLLVFGPLVVGRSALCKSLWRVLVILTLLGITIESVH